MIYWISEWLIIQQRTRGWGYIRLFGASKYLYIYISCVNFNIIYSFTFLNINSTHTEYYCHHYSVVVLGDVVRHLIRSDIERYLNKRGTWTINCQNRLQKFIFSKFSLVNSWLSESEARPILVKSLLGIDRIVLFPRTIRIFRFSDIDCLYRANNGSWWDVSWFFL